MQRWNITVDIAQGIERNHISLSPLFRATDSLGLKTHDEDIRAYLRDFSTAMIYALQSLNIQLSLPICKAASL